MCGGVSFKGRPKLSCMCHHCCQLPNWLVNGKGIKKLKRARNNSATKGKKAGCQLKRDASEQIKDKLEFLPAECRSSECSLLQEFLVHELQSNLSDSGRCCEMLSKARAVNCCAWQLAVERHCFSGTLPHLGLVPGLVASKCGGE